MEEQPSKKPKFNHFRSVCLLEKIISGGQTGADQGGLEAGEVLNLNTGGTAPKGYITLDGPCPQLGNRFYLKELNCEDIPIDQMYVKRSKLNVDNSDGTIAFRLYSSPGTDCTIGYCLNRRWKSENLTLATKYKPLLVLTDLSEEERKTNIKKIQNFLSDNKIKTLNVCGHREGKDTGFKSFSHVVKELLVDAILPKLHLFNE